MNEVKKIIYNCHKATMLIEKKQLARLTIREKMELKLHLAGCSVCKLFQQQSILINKQVRSLFHSNTQKEHVLDDTFKKELQARIEEKMQ
jgi:hypothetical protein